MTARTPRPPAICLMGPTAAGKTALAVELVRQLPLEIINVDSAQVYRGMDIGTGKPDADTLARAPHRLIDILDPSEPYSAAAFRRDALREMRAIREQGRTPLLVGGTMMYFRALRDGLAELPEADPAVRQWIEALARKEGWPAVHHRLAAVDPESAARIHPTDPQRLQRALEVHALTGRPLSALQAESRGADSGFDLFFLAIQPERRSVLHEKIGRRFRSMVDTGLIEEVDALYRRGDLGEHLPSIRSVGYRQVWQHLRGELRYEAMIERGIIATRQLAKRQMTWLRGWRELSNLDSEDPELISRVLKLLRPNVM